MSDLVAVATACTAYASSIKTTDAPLRDNSARSLLDGEKLSWLAVTRRQVGRL